MAGLDPTLAPGSAEFVLRPTPPSRWDVESLYDLRSRDGDGHVIERSRDELSQLASEGRLYQGDELGACNELRNLPCSAAVVTDEMVEDAIFIDLGFGLVRREMRGQGLIHLTLAAALASRFLFYDEQALAVVAVTTSTALESQSALSRLGAVHVDHAQAAALHPAVAEFRARCERNADARGLDGSGALLWCFPHDSLRKMLLLVWRAGSDEGLPWGEHSARIIRVDRALADPGARHLLRKMIEGKATMPVTLPIGM